MKKAPGKRRHGRELAVQLIYARDHNSTPFDEALPKLLAFVKEDGEPLVSEERTRIFGTALVRGVVEHWDEIDERIKQTTENFKLTRIGGVERAVMRLAIYEMLYCLDVPPVVAINEAVDIAKKFAGDEGGRFINGVLDKVCAGLNRPSRTAASPIAYLESQMARAMQEPGTKAEEFSPGQPKPPAES
jgi:N utilization substance protein B